MTSFYFSSGYWNFHVIVNDLHNSVNCVFIFRFRDCTEYEVRAPGVLLHFARFKLLCFHFSFKFLYMFRRALRDFRLTQSHFLSGDRACRPGILPFSVSLLHKRHRMIVMANVSISTIGMFSRASFLSHDFGLFWDGVVVMA